MSGKLTSALSLTSVSGKGNMEEKLKEEREKTESERRKNGTTPTKTQLYSFVISAP